MNIASGSGHICAVVVTFNRRDLLTKCLRGILSQSVPADHILIVNNASTDGTAEMLRRDFPQLEVLHLPENIGASGGFYEGFKWAHERGFDWIWATDDDGTPAPDCLEILLARRGEQPEVIVPRQRDSQDRDYGFVIMQGKPREVTQDVIAGRHSPTDRRFLFAWVGCLVPRQAIDAIGLPARDFFIWFDDSEYALRLRKHGGIGVRCVPEAVMFHDMGDNRREVKFLGIRSLRSDVPAWKMYYGTRNMLYTLLRARGVPTEIALFFLVHLRQLLMDVMYEPDRWTRVRLRLKGMFDGVFGRLGKRLVPTAAVRRT
jgi:rhamnopyranosyl-N-acetylglucosaminyl-diphospho-decaprenol beta-1,3/1,4-galactofuranosyltransferase